MKNVENIQIQGEKQRAIYYLVEKNEKWFFRSLYPFHPVKDTAAWVVCVFLFQKASCFSVSDSLSKIVLA